MITGILAGVLALSLPPQQMDTTFAVRSGATLAVDVQAGSVTVRTWDRSEMRVRSSDERRSRIRNSGSRVRIETSQAGGVPRFQRVQYEITVPRSTGIEVDGINVAVDIDGVRGRIEVDNVEGAVTVRRITGDVDVASVSGAVLVENVRGSVHAGATNQSVTLRGITGSVTAEAVNGNIVMESIDAAAVEGHTVNGTVRYDGTVKDGGRYSLGTHNGLVSMSIPERTNATLRIATFNGKVQAGFPVQIGAMRDGATQLTFGSGSARIDLETFNGSISLVRPSGR